MQPLATVRPRLQQAVVPPSARGAGDRAVFVLGALLTGLGLLTVSWERFGNLTLASYNVKLPVLLFAAAAVLMAPRWLERLRGSIRTRGPGRWVVVLAAAAVVVFTVRGVTSFPLGLGLAQIAAVLSGAVLPALAVLGVARSRDDVAWALRWLVAGAVITSLFGFYQLLAFYTGLPQGVVYTGVGTSGAGGRISAFSYEPAYFAYSIVLAIGALIALAHLTGRRVSWLAVGFFVLVLVLVNVRALLFVIPLLAVLLAVEWRRNRLLLLRGAIAGVVLLGVTALVPLALAALPTPGATGDGTAASAGPTPSASPSSAGAVPVAPQLPGDVLDPSEPSSNGPRLELYKAVLQVDLRSPVIGVGPGHLRDALAANGYVAPNQGPNVVANNIWLQAVADGGVVLLALEAAAVVALAVLWWRMRRTPAHPMASATLAVLLVGGMLTSYFFDIKVWVAVALTLALAAVSAQTAEREPSASE